MAPSMFRRNMKVRRIPISAWNLSVEKIQVDPPSGLSNKFFQNKLEYSVF
jgi:hypothetical protein